MKKCVALLLTALMFIITALPCSVFAEGTVVNTGDSISEKPENNNLTEAKYFSDKIYLSVHVELSANFIPGNMVFGVYSSDGRFLEEQKIIVTDIPTDYKITFNVPEYSYGDTFYIRLLGGAAKIQYSDNFYGVDDMIPLKTNTRISPAGEAIYENEFSINAFPLSSRYINAYANGWELYFKNPAKIINNTCFIPLTEYLEALEMTDCMVFDNTTGRIEINSALHKVVFRLNGNDMYADNKVTHSDIAPLKVNGVIYVPFRFLVEGLGGKITTETDNNGKLKIYAFLRREPSAEDFVNTNGITSKTDYLVWVSKKNYTVTVFTDNNGKWKAEKTFPCSIGAVSTPTVTGQFEYFSKENRWSYKNYYVGPIMRFYKGYALHSTLIKYDGTTADGRLGMKISHGCVRLAPSDIQWLVDMVPLHSTIYVTNE